MTVAAICEATFGVEAAGKSQESISGCWLPSWRWGTTATISAASLALVWTLIHHEYECMGQQSNDSALTSQ